MDVTMETGPRLDPDVAPLVNRAVELFAGRRLVILTGAGVSTDSGIPDYRGAGAPVRTPMTIDRFLVSLAKEQKERAIGVILTGLDGDGAVGVQVAIPNAQGAWAEVAEAFNVRSSLRRLPSLSLLPPSLFHNVADPRPLTP